MGELVCLGVYLMGCCSFLYSFFFFFYKLFCSCSCMKLESCRMVSAKEEEDTSSISWVTLKQQM